MISYGHTTSLPLATNSVSIDPELKDAWGIPAIRTTYRDHPDDLAMARFLQNHQVAIFEAAGAQRVGRVPIGEATFSPHLLGTCRMGNDPKHSVIDRFHRTHDVRNLFLCDGSSFVTSGRGQPTHDDPGAGVSRRRTYRAIRARQRNLICIEWRQMRAAPRPARR